ncbi:MAG: hypothetical protein MH252_18115 [Thermosynechococcaceae cyanobacterium MS004]|nr:hypothetical protein [Thermosynechococcaceae cyanobacterium MS004]
MPNAKSFGLVWAWFVRARLACAGLSGSPLLSLGAKLAQDVPLSAGLAPEPPG